MMLKHNWNDKFRYVVTPREIIDQIIVYSFIFAQPFNQICIWNVNRDLGTALNPDDIHRS